MEIVSSRILNSFTDPFLFYYMIPKTTMRGLWMNKYRQFINEMSHLHLFKIMDLFE